MLELAAKMDFSGLSTLVPYNPVTLCRVLRTFLFTSVKFSAYERDVAGVFLFYTCLSCTSRRTGDAFNSLLHSLFGCW